MPYIHLPQGEIALQKKQYLGPRVRTAKTWAACGSAIAATLMTIGCGQRRSVTSAPKDIYQNDAATRHEANADEVVWTVFQQEIRGNSIGLCTGSMLTSKYLLTANHCDPSPGSHYQTGAALREHAPADLKVVRVVENSNKFDYAIVEVAWTKGVPTEGQKYSPTISTQAEDLVLGRDDVGTPLVTVGFPGDKNLDYPRTGVPRAYYAAGFAKRYTGNTLEYNIGTINGNSGGAVWREGDHQLVSLTNGGHHNYGESGWNHNDPEDPQAWNSGAALYMAYAQSKTLRAIFPDGVNPLVDADGNLKPQ